jgi:glycerate 2-kinase
LNILIAPDSFKDALSAIEVCKAIERGARRALPTAEVQLFPLADGGEGTAEVLAWHLPGELVKAQVHDPLLRPVEAQYFSFGKMAFVEMAEASGLQRLEVGERNPLKTSTFGTGELLRHAMENGAEEVFLAIGGSATNDAGMGMAAALGWRFLDKNGKELAPVGENLDRVMTIVPPQPKSEARNPTWKVLCDVTAPLYGPSGAAYVFAKQKGADDAVVEQLDAGLRHFAGVVERQLGKDFSQVPGAGAAGGLGFGAMAFLGASVQSGAETILQLTGFESFVKKADLIITGEGRLDRQTGQGKLLAAICRKAKQYNVPVVAICGAIEAIEAELSLLGLMKALQIRRPGEELEAAISRTIFALEDLAYNLLKTIRF